MTDNSSGQSNVLYFQQLKTRIKGSHLLPLLKLFKSMNHLEKKFTNRLNTTLHQFGYISLNAIVNSQLRHHRKFTIINLKKETELLQIQHINRPKRPLNQQFINLLEKQKQMRSQKSS